MMAISFEKWVARLDDLMRSVGEFLNLKNPFEKGRIQKVMAREIVSQRKNAPPELYEFLDQEVRKMLANEIRWYESVVPDA